MGVYYARASVTHECLLPKDCLLHMSLYHTWAVYYTWVPITYELSITHEFLSHMSYLLHRSAYHTWAIYYTRAPVDQSNLPLGHMVTSPLCRPSRHTLVNIWGGSFMYLLRYIWEKGVGWEPAISTLGTSGVGPFFYFSTSVGRLVVHYRRVHLWVGLVALLQIRAQTVGKMAANRQLSTPGTIVFWGINAREGELCAGETSLSHWHI